MIECNITHEALQLLLSVPKGLTELHLGKNLRITIRTQSNEATGENCYHQWLNSPQYRNNDTRTVSQLCSTDAENFFDSLEENYIVVQS